MNRTRPVPVLDDCALAVELAAAGLRGAAPEELVVLDETAEDYFADPDGALRAGREEAVAGGIDFVLLTPYLLAAANVVLPILAAFVGDVVKDVATDTAKDAVTGAVRRLIKGRPDEPLGPAALTDAQAGQVWQAVRDNLRLRGATDNEAVLAANATIGSLHVRP